MARQPSNCSLKCHLSVRATVPTNLGSLGVGFFFLLPWSAPLPQMVVLSSNISAELEPTRKAFLLLPANTPPTPTPSVFSFFCMRLEQFGSVLGAFLWPILFQSPVWDPGWWTQRTQAHIQPQHGVAGGGGCWRGEAEKRTECT